MNGGIQEPSILAMWSVERAASRQMQALARLRLAQDRARRCSTSRRHQLLIEVVEHLAMAERHLACARKSFGNQPGHIASVDDPISKVADLRAKAERLLQSAI